MNVPSDSAVPDSAPNDSSVHDTRLAPLALAALGVVFGDIGTSPLYAMRECFSGHYGLHPTPDNVLGILSLIFWALIIVIYHPCPQRARSGMGFI